jgi:DivIVA domain-containing protein
VNGDEIRDVRFDRRPYGYDAFQVEDLLGRLATEVDAGRLIGSLLAKATFRRTGLRRPGYGRESVDWFLDQLRITEDRARSGSDPWCHLAVADYFASSGPGLHQECAGAWRDFGQVPGTQLRWLWAGLTRRELQTIEQHTIAYRRGTGTFSTGHRSFTVKTVTASSWPGVAEIADRYARDYDGHFLDPDAPGTRLSKGFRRDRFKAAEYRDEAGRPVLYASERHIGRQARGRVTFPDQRWLRFPVRSTSRRDAIMTAVDQDGNKVARYRVTGRLWGTRVEITVHPDSRLTDELVLAILIAAPWLPKYFESEGGGG